MTASEGTERSLVPTGPQGYQGTLDLSGSPASEGSGEKQLDDSTWWDGGRDWE